jgi:LPXTG-site transpeptidase (sortase) family protein
MSIPSTYAASDVAMTIEISADGSPTWDSMSFNTGTLADAGYDSSPTNGIVRSLDTISYVWKIRGNVEAPQNLTINHTLPVGVTWTELPPACLTSGVSPLSSLSWDKRTIVCNIGDKDVATLYAVTALARVGAGFLNGDLITTDASGSASNGGGIAPSNSISTVVTLGTRIEVEKFDGLYSYWNTYANITPGPNGEVGRVIPYAIGLYLERGSEVPQSGNFNLQDQLRYESGWSISGALLYTWGRLWATAACSINGAGYSDSAYFDLPFGAPGLGQINQTSANSVPDSGTITCSQAGGGGTDVDISITGADVSLINHPDHYIFSQFVPNPISIVNKFYFGTYVINLWVPLSTLQNISPYGETRISNTITWPWGTAFDPVGISGNSNYGAWFESSANNASTGVLLAHNENNIVDPIFNPYPVIIALDNSISKNNHARTQTTFAGTGVTIVSNSNLLSVDYYSSTQIDMVTCVKTDPSQVRFNGNINGSTSATNINAPSAGWYAQMSLRMPYNLETTTGLPYTAEYSVTPFVTNIRDDNCSDIDGPWYPVTNTGMLSSGVTKVRYKNTIPASLSGVLFQLYRGEYEVLDRPAGSKVWFFYSQSYDDGATWYNDNDASINEWDANYAAPTNRSPTWLQNRMYGDVLTINQADVRISKDTIPSNTATVFAGGTQAFVLYPTFSGSPGLTNTPQNIVIEDILPNGMNYVSGSLALDSGYPQLHISGSWQLLRWTLSVPPSTPITPIEYTVRISSMALDIQSLVNTTTISSPLDISSLSDRTAIDTVNVVNTQAFPIYKSTQHVIREVGNTLDFKLQYRNQFLAGADTARFIDIFPFNWDSVGLGRGGNPTDYIGSLSLLSYSGSNGELYRFTDANPSTLFDDPCHVNNVPAGAVPGGPGAESCMSFTGWSVWVGSVAWCLADQFGNPGCPANLANTTAMNVFVPNPIPGASPIYNIDLTFSTAGNRLDDIYTNSFGGRVKNTDLYIRALPVSIRIIASELGDRVWLDTNQDGVQDASENGIPGISVMLSWTNDLLQNINLSTTTNGSGVYNFYGLRWGTYTISLSGVTSYTATYDLDGTGTLYSVTTNVGRGSERTDVDFGLYAMVSLGSVWDRVWYDTDGDGVQNSGEMWLSGVTMSLSWAGYSGTALTNGSGEYLFSGIPAGNYSVSVSGLPTGMGATYDLDGTGTLSIANFSLLWGENKLDIDFGYRYPLWSIGDRVWLDTDSDWVQDGGENGLSGVTLTLSGVDILGATINTNTITNGSGYYLFSNVLSGSYTITTNVGTGYVATYDLDGTGSLSVAWFLLGNGENKLNVDFGYRLPLPGVGSIGDRIWLDANNNGSDDAEAWINGLTVELSGTTYTGASVSLSTTTNGSGSYMFSNVYSGSYIVTVTIGTGYATTYDLDGTGTLSRVNLSLAEWENRTDADFGYRLVAPSPASLSGTLWEDLDSDGVIDGGENFYSGMTVILILSGSTVATGMTNMSGTYAFTGLGAGVYTVTVMSPPAGTNQTYDTNGIATPNTTNETLTVGQNRVNVNFGYVTPPPPGASTGSLGDRVWIDLDGDGSQDVWELGMSGVTLTLSGLTSTGLSVSGTRVSDANGNYTFENLLPGNYSVRASVGTWYMATYDLDGTGSLGIATVSLSAGQYRSDVDFWYRIPPLLTGGLRGTIWLDSDRNTGIDPGEQSYSGITVEAVSGGSVYSTTTDASGNYVLNNLPPWAYVIRVVTPPNGTTATYDTDGISSPHITSGTVTANVVTNNVNFWYALPDAPRAWPGGGGWSISIQPSVSPSTLPPEKVNPPQVIGDLPEEPLADFWVKYNFAQGVRNFILPKTLPATGKRKPTWVYTTPSKYLMKYKSAENAPTDIAAWTKNLPETDRNRERYVVIPVAGIISPVNDIPESSSDFNTLISGKEIKVNPHLKTGVARYPNSALPGSPGNLVIFWHSSYLNNDDGRYKTIFQTLIGMPSGTEVWVYEKRGQGMYERYRYRVDMSYNTKPTDVWVLEPGNGENITLITCTPIGDLSGRWVVKWERLFSNGDKCSYADSDGNSRSGIYYEGSCRSTDTPYAESGMEKNIYKNFLYHYTSWRVDRSNLIDYMSSKYTRFSEINSRLRNLMENMVN